MKQLMNSQILDDTLEKISCRILDTHPEAEEIALLGIRTKGNELALRIASKIKAKSGIEVPVGIIDTSLYRDDVNVRRPILCKTEIPFGITGKKIILVDDVLYTGRTIRAALDAIIDLGRPGCIQLAVLVDRGHRELPIHADYIGLKVNTTRNESVRVIFKKDPSLDEVIIRQEPDTKKW